ncbi:MAG: tRNA (N6-threonylcarbamoyladenosine(37)-N6)-methyltransferase TrmO [Deltaproteobacteria bacterium]|nr:tRNA (N6-threonylcarbamoyladenosine(37)-N6)-methyltransferase TrmO [Candidatus Anaeroferrophillacea bacterium]
MDIILTPIGTIHTPFTDRHGMPIQPAGGRGIRGTVEVRSEYRAGLQDLDGFSHIVLLYHFHGSRGFQLQVVPFMDDRPHGVFATRAPRRPNPVGMSVVRLTGLDGGTLQVEDVDILDGTPLLDIKPFVPAFDVPETVARLGWLETVDKTVGGRQADDRFTRHDGTADKRPADCITIARTAAPAKGTPREKRKSGRKLR